MLVRLLMHHQQFSNVHKPHGLKKNINEIWRNKSFASCHCIFVHTTEQQFICQSNGEHCTQVHVQSEKSYKDNSHFCQISGTKPLTVH